MKDVKFYQLEGKNVLALLSGSVEGAEPIAVGSVGAAKESNSSNPVKNRKPYSQPSTPASYTNRAISTVFGKRNFKG